MQDSKPNLSDIAIPETVEVAIMQWWNSGVNANTRDCSSSEAYRRLKTATEAVKVALLALSTNPVVPSDEDSCEMYRHAMGTIGGSLLQHRYMLTEFQRRMFLRKPDPVPEEVKELLFSIMAPAAWRPSNEEANERIMAAFNAGKEFRDADKN